jgi:hypothetical protein
MSGSGNSGSYLLLSQSVDHPVRSPILLLVFNRPDTTLQVLEAIRVAKPPRLYVAADGPRQDREGETERCADVRRIATNVDWPCEVNTLFQERNLGCKLGPVSGISWFFRHEEEGVILEDDILPLPSFFAYCDELLERYRDDERVGLISGNNLISKRFTPQDSYFFSRYMHVWGWASWRRAWEHYDVDVRAWPAWRDRGGLRSISDGNRLFESCWRDVFDRAFRGEADWWSYQWLLACWVHGMLAALPARSQTQNLGFGPDSTHTRGSAPTYVRESISQALLFPLQHPSRVAPTPGVDRMIGRDVHGLTLRGSINGYLNAIKRFLRNIPCLGALLKRLQVRLIDAKHYLPRGRP